MGARNMDTWNLDYSSYGQTTWKLGLRWAHRLQGQEGKILTRSYTPFNHHSSIPEARKHVK